MSKLDNLNNQQWRSQNAQNVTHIKWRLLDQTVIQFNCATFHKWNICLKKEFAPRGKLPEGANYLLLEQCLMAWKITFTI